MKIWRKIFLKVSVPFFPFSLSLPNYHLSSSLVFPRIEPTGVPIASEKPTIFNLENEIKKNPFYPFQNALEKKVADLLFSTSNATAQAWLKIFNEDLAIPDFSLTKRSDIEERLGLVNEEVCKCSFLDNIFRHFPNF